MHYFRADKGFIMFDGTIACSGNPQELLDDVRRNGYEGCVKCRTKC
jgi:Fe-S cluster assembly ATP-binding protein